MLPPEVIDRMIREREQEERERPALQIPLPMPEWRPPEHQDDEEQTFNGVIVIDLA